MMKMPRVRMCRKAGCYHEIPYDQPNPYCSQHSSLYHGTYSRLAQHKRRTSYQSYNRYKRDKEANTFYQSKQWKKLSRWLKEQAYFTCACCGHTYDKPGYLVTDHIVPRRVDRRKQLEVNNLWVICKRCHYWKGQLEDELYQSQSLIQNLDVSKQWDRDKVTAWIMKHEK